MSSISFWILNQKVNLVPMPISEATSMSPSNTWQICLQILRPSPIPFELIFLLYFSFPNSLKSFGMSSCEMPIPLSLMYTWMKLLYPICTRSLPTSIIPWGLVNLRALLRRFRVTCWILCESVSTFTSWFLKFISLFSITFIFLLLAWIS